MSKQLQKAPYLHDHKPGIASFVDSSKLRIGRNCLYNRLNCVKNIAFQWTNRIDQDKLRVELKKTFIGLDYNSVHFYL